MPDAIDEDRRDQARRFFFGKRPIASRKFLQTKRDGFGPTARLTIANISRNGSRSRMLQGERKLSAPDYKVGDDEISLRERLRRGDPAAAREFYEAYSARIHRFILHALGPGNNADAEDILQDTFMALAEALPFFRGQSSLFTFACAIAHRKTVSFVRTRARRGALMRIIPRRSCASSSNRHPIKI